MEEKKDIEVCNGGVTPEQIQAWKAKYRKVAEISVTDGNTKYVGYFRRPDMDTMAAVNRLAKTDEVKSSVAMFDNCWLGGDVTMKEDAIVKMAAIARLATMFDSCVAELKNL